MTNEENLNFRLTKIDEKRNFLLDEIKHDLMSEKYKKTCKYLNYIKHLLILTITSTITGCLSISAFACICLISSCSFGITSSEIGINICPINAGIKK